jgi:integrase
VSPTVRAGGGAGGKALPATGPGRDDDAGAGVNVRAVPGDGGRSGTGRRRGSSGGGRDGRSATIAAGPVRPVGLLEKLMAAVRPQFRCEVLVFDPRDPVFGGPPCAVPGCVRPTRQKGLCTGHVTRWREQGCPDLAVWTATTGATFLGNASPLPCVVPDCGFGRQGEGLCPTHYDRWRQVGCPPLAEWVAGTGGGPCRRPPTSAPAVGCLVPGCTVWAHGTSQLCFTHRRRWRRAGRPEVHGFVEELAAAQEYHAERIDLRRLPVQLRLEIAYALQCRRDEATARLIPQQVQGVVSALADTELTSLLEVCEEDWVSCPPSTALKKRLGALALVRDAYRRVEALAFGRGWDVEYPRPVWRLANLDLPGVAVLDFTGIAQPWLQALAKRWAHRQLTTGLSAATASHGLRAVTRFAAWLARSQVGVDDLGGIDRAVLERYLGDLRVELGGRRRHRDYVAGLAGFLRALHQFGWAADLPASAQLFPDTDYPTRGPRLPRGLPAAVMAQVETPANLDRWRDPAHRVITLILIQTGLRISSAVGLPFDCVATDTDDAPYLRYWNTKMRREALVPIDEDLRADIGEQQQRVLARYPGGSPVLFPRPRANLDGTKPTRTQCYRDALEVWLADCDVRDEHGQPVHLTPHQWRHTLGTTLINKDVPQHVVQRILDHDSAEMTAHYARLSDKTVRRHWEAARKVNNQGETVHLQPDRLLDDAAWARHRLDAATQALPNGYCGLPTVKTCEHANACLTCPLFLTSAEFLPEHHAQHRQTLAIIAAAVERGNTRMAAMNQQVADNLQKIIKSLEADLTAGHHGHGDPAGRPCQGPRCPGQGQGQGLGVGDAG